VPPTSDERIQFNVNVHRLLDAAPVYRILQIRSAPCARRLSIDQSDDSGDPLN
jgi:hypothetical protein